MLIAYLPKFELLGPVFLMDYGMLEGLATRGSTEKGRMEFFTERLLPLGKPSIAL